MPVPKKTTETAPAETVETEPVEAATEPVEPVVIESAPSELDLLQLDFQRRRAAIELAIAAREMEPLAAAPGYHAFLAGNEPDTEVPA